MVSKYHYKNYPGFLYNEELKEIMISDNETLFGDLMAASNFDFAKAKYLLQHRE
jgi:hypothetical protein